MKNSIKNRSADLLNFIIETEGLQIPHVIEVFEIKVVHQINKISKAEITFNDGLSVDEPFEVSSSKTFNLGNHIKIKAGYSDSKRKSIFSGVVSKQKIKINPDSPSKLIVESNDFGRQIIYDAQSLLDKSNTRQNLFYFLNTDIISLNSMPN